MMKKLLFTMVLALCANSVFAQDLKIGVVNTGRILRDSAPAKVAQQKLENEFSKRQKEIEDLSLRLKTQSERYEKDAPTLSESDRNRRQRELADLDRDIQRRQREFREDLNQRRSEEHAALIERANRVIKQLAEAEKIDLILEDAVHASPRIDITDKVIRALNNNK
jgi:outer membrane protein